MSEIFTLDGIPHLSQADFLHQLVPILWQRPNVLAVWLEGSMGRGNADRYSDVDLYVGVENGTLDEWRALAVAPLFADQYAAHLLSVFSEDFFVYHVYLTTGGIYDLHIQPQSRSLPKAERLILACRPDAYRAALLAAAPNEADASIFAPQPLDPAIIHELIVSFWINVDKGRKVLYRNQDFTTYAGLHLFRHWLARLRFIEQTGTDCGDLTRPTIHGLKAAAAVLGPALAGDLGVMMGSPATNRQEIAQAQALLQQAVARVGRALAAKYQLDYPTALEQVVMQNWQRFMTDELQLNH